MCVRLLNILMRILNCDSDFDNWGETCSVLNKNNSEVDGLETSIVQMFIPWRSQAKNEKKTTIFQYSTKLERSVVVYLINSFQGIGLFCEGEKKMTCKCE